MFIGQNVRVAMGGTNVTKTCFSHIGSAYSNMKVSANKHQVSKHETNTLETHGARSIANGGMMIAFEKQSRAILQKNYIYIMETVGNTLDT